MPSPTRSSGGSSQRKSPRSYRARANYRSPDLVARFIKRSLPFAFEPANDLPGQGVGISSFDDPEEQPAKVAAIVDALLKQGFRYEDIVVLACCSHQRSIFANRQRAGHHTLKHFTLMVGSKEDAETVTAFFEDMKMRGLGDPLLVTSDGAPGVIKAIEACFPLAARQRCLAHGMRNLAAKVPEDVWPDFKARVQAAYQAPSRAIARELDKQEHAAL
jgi:hypothetical protein